MRKNKYIVILLGLGILLLSLFLLLKIDSPSEEPHLSVLIKNADGHEIIVNAWTKPDSDTAFFFLPSCVQVENCVFLTKHDCHIGGHFVRDGSSASYITTDCCYEYRATCEKCGTIANVVFMQSQNIASLHLSYGQKTEEKVCSDRNIKATIAASLYSAKGVALYENNDVKINSRGNSTWRLPKKAYVLTLPAPAGLLGMPEGRKWVLLANGYDETNLRNAIVFDFAQKLGFAWTPRCDYVDLYTNGEYRGVYMLTEKIEIDSNRLNIRNNGGTLLCMTSQNRIRARGITDFFVTKNNQSLEFIEKNTQNRDDVISEFQKVENAIMAAEDTMNRLKIESCLDLDSWVKKYLVDEIFENEDGGIRSSYFYTYYSNDSLKIHGGPIWDYDMAIGNTYGNSRPNTLVTLRIHATTNDYSPYYNKLYHNKLFFDRIKDIYKNKCIGILDSLTESGIYEMANKIDAASKMNSLRWEGMFKEYRDKVKCKIETTDGIVLWLKKRKSFLDSAWISEVPYCLVFIKYEPEAVFYTYTVVKGELLQTVINVDSIRATNKQYVDETGNLFDFLSPIYEDVELRWSME